MNATTTPDTEIAPDLMERGLKLSPGNRFLFAMQMLASLDPKIEESIASPIVIEERRQPHLDRTETEEPQ